MNSLSPAAILYSEKDVVSVNFRKADVEDTSFFLMIDKSNASGKYKHSSGDGIHLVQVEGTLIKTNLLTKWICFVGVVLSIDATGMTVGCIRSLGTIGLRDTSGVQGLTRSFAFPSPIDLTVSGGDFESVLTNYKPYTTNVNTSTPIEDVGGDMVVPEPGDLIMYLLRVGSDGTAIVHYTFSYFVK